MIQQRNSNRGLCYFLIFAGLGCLFGTLILTLSFNDTLKKKIRKPSSVGDVSLVFEIDSVDQKIQLKDQEIKIVKLKLDAQQSLEEARDKLNSLAGNKNSGRVPSSASVPGQAEMTKQLELEKAQLIAKKEALIKKWQERNAPKKSWRGWYEAYNIKFILAPIVPLALFGFFLMRLTFFSGLPQRNPFSLTDFERRCVLFLPFSIVVSAFGFALFVWTLTITA